MIFFWSSSSVLAQVTGIMISGRTFLTFLSSASFGGGFEDGADLVLGDFRIGDAEADAAVTHHRVGLVQALGALLEFLHGDAERVGPVPPGGPASFGTNSCSGGSSVRIVTGWPCIASIVAFMSAFMNG